VTLHPQRTASQERNRIVAPDETMHLQLRLKNCLNTILELEPALEQLELGHMLLKDYATLRSFIEKLEEVALHEDDVQRIERATSNFLEELKLPLAFSEDKAAKRQQLH